MITNLAPYFEDESDFEPRLWQIERGDELVIQLPEVRDDDDDDEVTLTVTLTAEQENWIEFDSTFRLITVRPN